MKPRTQKEQVLWYLIYWSHRYINLKEVINDSMFYKFQTRLSELEKEYGILTKKKRIKFTNRFGHAGSHIGYKALNMMKCREIYAKLQAK